MSKTGTMSKAPITNTVCDVHRDLSRLGMGPGNKQGVAQGDTREEAETY